MKLLKTLINGGIVTLLVLVLLASCAAAYGMWEDHSLQSEAPDVVYEGPAETEHEAVELDMVDIDPAELELLAIAIYAEAGSNTCSDETRRMVGEVILNRVADDRFPDTVRSVLTECGQYGMFYYTGVIWPDRAGYPSEEDAVARAYECARMVMTEPRLLPEDAVWQAEFIQGVEIVAHQDGLYFCR